MSFFDLSIPYLEKPGEPVSETRSRRDSRLRTAARAMELGYTAIAYDRPCRGVLSDADRCNIAPFTAQSFLQSVDGGSPSAFTATVALHRNLLGVPYASPFRQYTRITVSVDSVAAASALNSGNRLLRSYDLVATRPVNQMAFDQACNASEVDIISFDFSQKLPFRLKLAMIQAAIKRGVHFEISYSHLIADSHARRQILSEAKRLGEWTRGKNLIISGSATSLNEIRGPHDVANLSTILLGLTMERAKAAISGNCRSLVANALRKKDCYFKEAIRIERILPADEKMGSEGVSWFKDFTDWDPISSGANDLPSLDDMAKLFSAASTHSKSQNAIDFTSSINGMSPNSPLFSCADKHELDSVDENNPSDAVKQHNTVDHVNVENTVVIMVAKSITNAASNEETRPCLVESDMTIDAFGRTSVCGAEMIETHNMGKEEAKITDQIDASSVFIQTPRNASNSLYHCFIHYRDQMSMADNETVITVEEEHYLEKNIEDVEKLPSSGDVQLSGYPDKIKVHEQLVIPLEASSTSNDFDKIGGYEQFAVRLQTSTFDEAQVNMKQKNQQDSASTGVILSKDSSTELKIASSFGKRNNLKGFATKTKCKKMHISTEEILEDGVLALEDPCTAAKVEQHFSPENDSPVVNAVVKMEEENIQRPAGGVTTGQLHKSEKHKHKGRSHHRGYLLTAKNVFKSMLFKKKARRLRRMPKFL